MLETIVQRFRKIIQLSVVIILHSINEYYRKIISKSGRKMDLELLLCGSTPVSFTMLAVVLDSSVNKS